MLKKTIKYTDFNGDEVSEDYFFHLSKAELIELEMSHEGGLSVAMQKIIDNEDGKAIMYEFKKIILMSYGKKSADGRRFVKTQELRDEFESSEAYSTLFVELVTDADSAASFVNGIVPPDLAEEAAQTIAKTSENPKPIRVVTEMELREMPAAEKEELLVQIHKGEARFA